jgi:hypothetical protein
LDFGEDDDDEEKQDEAKPKKKGGRKDFDRARSPALTRRRTAKKAVA